MIIGFEYNNIIFSVIKIEFNNRIYIFSENTYEYHDESLNHLKETEYFKAVKLGNILSVKTNTGITFSVGDILTNYSNRTIMAIYLHHDNLKIRFDDLHISNYTELLFTKKEKLSLEKLEEKIKELNPKKLRLENTLLKSIKNLTLCDFLYKFFVEFNYSKNTIYVENKQIQTEAGRRRSLGDIYCICKYYFPNCSLKEILRILYVDLHETLDGFRTSYCYTINKRVWYWEDPDDDNEQCDKLKEDEFGYIFNDYLTLL